MDLHALGRVGTLVHRAGRVTVRRPGRLDEDVDTGGRGGAGGHEAPGDGIVADGAGRRGRNGRDGAPEPSAMPSGATAAGTAGSVARALPAGGASTPGAAAGVAGSSSWRAEGCCVRVSRAQRKRRYRYRRRRRRRLRAGPAGASGRTSASTPVPVAETGDAGTCGPCPSAADRPGVGRGWGAGCGLRGARAQRPEWAGAVPGVGSVVAAAGALSGAAAGTEPGVLGPAGAASAGAGGISPEDAAVAGTPEAGPGSAGTRCGTAQDARSRPPPARRSRPQTPVMRPFDFSVA